MQVTGLQPQADFRTWVSYSVLLTILSRLEFVIRSASLCLQNL